MNEKEKLVYTKILNKYPSSIVISIQEEEFRIFCIEIEIPEDITINRKYQHYYERYHLNADNYLIPLSIEEVI